MSDHARGEAGSRRVAVLGLGNVLQSDDALGPYVVELLSCTYDFPPGVTVLDAGTPGLDLTPYIAGLDALIVVDAVLATGQPGELRAYRRDELLAAPPQQRLSPHDPGLKTCLLALEMVGESPSEVLLVGVIPATVATGVGLSEAVRNGVPAVVESVLAELSRLAVQAHLKPEPCVPNLWWERLP